MGIAVPDELRTSIAAAVQPLRATVRARWVRPESLHVTLCFLGAVPSDEAASVAGRAASALGAFGPFVAGLGAPSAVRHGSRPATVWVDLSTGRREVAELSAAAARALGMPQARPPHPHVTITREIPGADADRVTSALAAVAERSWRVDRAVLYRSHLGPGGSRYEPLADLPLRGVTGTS